MLLRVGNVIIYERKRISEIHGKVLNRIVLEMEDKSRVSMSLMKSFCEESYLVANELDLKNLIGKNIEGIIEGSEVLGKYNEDFIILRKIAVKFDEEEIFILKVSVSGIWCESYLLVE
jgi:hypothetical protein